MPSKKLKTPLLPDCYYHIYNRGNNRERIFFQEGDYRFFMEKYKNFVMPFAHTYAYCLLPNHFHFLIKTRPELDKEVSVVSNQLRKLFISYTIRINGSHRRSGSLFTKNFQRIEVNDEDYLLNLVIYIHQNPSRHGLLKNFSAYEHSSFDAFLKNDNSIIDIHPVLYWFGGKDEFHSKHLSQGDVAMTNDFLFLEGDGVPKK